MDSIVRVMNSVFDALKHNPFGAASLLAAVTVLLVFQWWRQRKAFSYRVISDYPLVGIDQKFSDRVKILFDDKPVDQVSLIVIELKNSGWAPIEDKDFYKRVEVNFGRDSEIMSTETVETRPKDMGIITFHLDSDLTIEPNLFNRGDYVRLKLLVHGYKGRINVSGRIKGVPRIKREGSGLGTEAIMAATMFGFLFVIVFYFFYSNAVNSGNTDTLVIIILLASLVTGLIISLFGSLFDLFMSFLARVQRK